MGVIRVNEIRVYSYHGCLDEEAAIGQNYTVDVCLHADLSRAAEHDDLDLTIDYVKVREIVAHEMGIRSKLIEHVAKRIINRFKKEFDILDRASVTVTKINPPINGHVRDVSVTMEG